MWYQLLRRIMDEALVMVITTAVRWRVCVLFLLWYKLGRGNPFTRTVLADIAFYVMTLVLVDMLGRAVQQYERDRCDECALYKVK